MLQVCFLEPPVSWQHWWKKPSLQGKCSPEKQCWKERIRCFLKTANHLHDPLRCSHQQRHETAGEKGLQSCLLETTWGTDENQMWYYSSILSFVCMVLFSQMMLLYLSCCHFFIIRRKISTRVEGIFTNCDCLWISQTLSFKSMVFPLLIIAKQGY